MARREYNRDPGRSARRPQAMMTPAPAMAAPAPAHYMPPQFPPPPPAQALRSVPPTLSVILGTYNRFEMLKRCIEATRRSLIGVDFEIVVCDGGSSDGSREWLAAQSDVVLIGDRRLTGAVAAFNNCYQFSRGEFIGTLNDDAYPVGYALGRGLAFMKEHGDVGQVAFAHGANGQYEIKDIHPGVPYANFGIIRRSVADAIVTITGGLWNPLYHTYAGDTELSSWVHRLGWRVEPLRDCVVEDLLCIDPLRSANHIEGKAARDCTLYWERWASPAMLKPNGPPPLVTRSELSNYWTMQHVGRVPKPSLWCSDSRESTLASRAPRIRALDPSYDDFPPRGMVRPSERVLDLHFVTPDEPQSALGAALKSIATSSRSIDLLRLETMGRLEDSLLAEARQFKPTLVFIQLQRPMLSGRIIRAVREAVRDSRLVIATWDGDIADVNSPWNPEWQVEVGRECDLSFFCNMSHVRVMRAHGLHSAAYLQTGSDEDLFFEEPFPRLYRHDVVFLGAHYPPAQADSLHGWRVGTREQVVDAMRRSFGERFGLFGTGWRWNTVTRFAAPCDGSARRAYASSRLAISASLCNDLEFYASNRLPRILACGTPALTKAFPGIDSWGLVHGENCLLWDTPEAAVQIAREWLSKPEALEQLGREGAVLARERHSWQARMRELVLYLDAVRDEHQYA
jgi:hypothetical protein